MTKLWAIRLLILFLIASVLYCCTSNNRADTKAVVKSQILIKKDSQKVSKGVSFAIVDSLKTLFSIADTLHPFGNDSAGDRISDINTRISQTLKRILKNPVITRQNLDSLLTIERFGVVHSDDKRLWLFTWYENTGGSFQSNLTIAYYKTGSGADMVADDSQSETAKGQVFVSAGAGFSKIYKLKSKTRDLYLCIGGGVGCNTCIFGTATVVELKRDSANFAYNAFKPASEGVVTYGENDATCLTFGTRSGDLEKFDFDPATQTLTIIYLTDDNTPIIREEGHRQRRIIRKLRFNGSHFIGDAFG